MDKQTRNCLAIVRRNKAEARIHEFAGTPCKASRHRTTQADRERMAEVRSYQAVDRSGYYHLPSENQIAREYEAHLAKQEYDKGDNMTTEATTQTTVAMHNPHGPASRSQLWALHCITRKDTRDWQITKQQAHDMISAYHQNKTMPTYGAVDLLHEDVGAVGAAEAIATICEHYKGDNIAGVVEKTILELTRFRESVAASVGGK